MTIIQHPAMRRWPKNAGPKPAQRTLRLVSTMSRPSSKDAMALAMAARPHGATQPEIISVLGGPHRNKLKAIVQNGHARRRRHPPRHGHMVYKLDLKK